MGYESDYDAKRTWLEVDGLRIACLEFGEYGPPVLLLHGGGIDSARFSYKHVIEPLSLGHQVFAPDWPGYGESEGTNLEHTTELYVDLLGRLMDVLGLERASLVGISMGGGAALGFALSAPERVEKLVLVDSYGLGGEVPLGRLGYLMVKTPLISDVTWALLRRSRRMARWSLYYVVHNRRAVTEEMVDEARELFSQPGAGQAFQSFQKSEVGWNGLRTNFTDRLDKIDVPTLIVHGEHDRFVPVAWAREAHEHIPGSELRIFDCGHMPPRERPEEFNRVVGQFLDS